MRRLLGLVVSVSILGSGCAFSPAGRGRVTAPTEAQASQLYAAIWNDIESNALIGNGNELAARWANAGSTDAEAPKLRIQNLLCSGGPRLLRCRFGLLRDGGIAAAFDGEPAPARLACTANFRRSRSDGRWVIPRLPPGPEGGHTRITIKCEPAS